MVLAFAKFQAIKNPSIEDAGVFGIRSLTMTYIAQAVGLRPFGPAVAALPRPAACVARLVTWGPL